MELDRYIEDLENRIDPEVEEDLLARWLAFTKGRFDGGLFTVFRSRPSPPSLEWPAVGVNAAFADFDAMVLQQLAGCSRLLADGSGAVMAVRSNYGTGIMPTLFGAEMFMMDDAMNTLPTTRPLSGIEAVRAVMDAGVPDLRRGLGAKVLEAGRRFAELGKAYPKIGRYVRIYHADLQGPMDICELLWGSALFYALVDRPDWVHGLLRLVTDTYKLFMAEWDRVVGVVPGPAVHWGFMHAGRIMLRDDSAMNLSPEMFDEFIQPYDADLLGHLGGGGIHFCGRGDHWIDRASSLPGLYAIHLSQPEHNDMEAIFRHTVDKGLHVLYLPRNAGEQALVRGRRLHGRVHCW